ncbi:hypothetical protein [Pelomonas sp. KK5]|uniref:hypothetical protein n=1 Tax=Pelomonas sp. KK5 TaxID=1855730 RepID=UPI00097C7370|nr:hypothetical protein [Pelomonas sp. KK5]
MTDKITESGWKAFVKGLKLDKELDDKELLKLLQRLDKTDERKPEPRLEALKALAKEIPKQVAAVTKQKKELGDKPFGKIKDQLYAMLDEAETLQKKTEAALDEAEPEEADEDSAAAALANPKLLLKQLNMCRQDPERTVSFAYVEAKDKQPAMLAMHPRMSVKMLFAKLQEASGVKAGSYGTAWVDGTSLMLQLDKPLSGLVKKIRQPVKACGFKIAKAVLWNADGTVFEADEQAEESVGVPDAPGLPTQQMPPTTTTTDGPKEQEHEQGHGDTVDPAVAFKARLGALIPKIKESATAQHPGAAAARLKASEAGVAAAKGDFTQAQLLLDEVEDLLSGKTAPPVVEARSKPEASPIEHWNEVRKELQPLVEKALETPGERATKVATAWKMAIELGGKGDFGRAELITDKLRAMLAQEVLPTPGQEEGKPVDSKVDVAQALLAARGEVARVRALMTAFGPSVPLLWDTAIAQAEKDVESVAGGTLEEIRKGAEASALVLKDLEPKIKELSDKKKDFEQKAGQVEDRHKQMGNLWGVKNDTKLKARLDQLPLDLQAAREQAAQFNYDGALVAVKAVLDRATQLDKDSDNYEKIRVIYQAREVLVNEANADFTGTKTGSVELSTAHGLISTEWGKVLPKWNTGAYDEALAASETIPALVATYKRKATIFTAVNTAPANLVRDLNADRNTYKELFERLYPKSLIDSIGRYADPGYSIQLDDKTFGELRGARAHLTAVRNRAALGVQYFQANDALVKHSQDLLSDDRSRRALRYVAADYRDRIFNDLALGKSHAARQDFEKAKMAVDASQVYSNEQQGKITRCVTYLAALDKTNLQLEKVQAQYTSTSAKAAAQACVLTVQEAETLALAGDFDGAEKQLDSVRKLLDGIEAAEKIDDALDEAKQAPPRETGSEDMSKDIALIESAIKSAEESSGQAGANFEWTALATAKLALSALRRANTAGDAPTANQERTKAMDALAGLTEQLSSYKTSQALHEALQTNIKASEALFGTLASSTLAVAGTLSTEFTDIKSQTEAKVSKPLAGGKEPAYEQLLQDIAGLQNRLATWRAAASKLAGFTADAAQAEIAIQALQTTDVPAVTKAFESFDATLKKPLEKLPDEQRHKALRTRKDELVNAAGIEALIAGAAAMKVIITEAAALKQATGEQKAAIVYVGSQLNAKITLIQGKVTLLGRQAAFDQLLAGLGSAAQAGSAAGLRVATSEIIYFDRMLDTLTTARTTFVNKYTDLTRRLNVVKSGLTTLARSSAVDGAVAVLQEKQSTPIGVELERLNTAGTADPATYLPSTVDVAKPEAQLVQLEADFAKLQPLAAPLLALEQQLKGLDALADVPAFKNVQASVQQLSQSIAQALSASPADFAKAKADLDAASMLASGATRAGAGAVASTPPKGDGGAPDYAQSVSELRKRYADLSLATTQQALDPKGLEPLKTAVDDIEKLSAELT